MIKKVFFMATRKKEKLFGLIFTSIVGLLYLALVTFYLVLTLQAGGDFPIETFTVMILQALAFVLLVIGIVLHKENLVLGTLVAALSSSVVSYLINDIGSILTIGSLLESEAWAYGVSLIATLIADSLLSIGTVIFLVYLLSGRGPRLRLLTSIFFLAYIVFALAGIAFLIVESVNDPLGLLFLISSVGSFVASFIYIVDIDAYFFSKGDALIYHRKKETREERLDRKEKSRNALGRLDKTISYYRDTILPASFKEKEGSLELLVDLSQSDLYEECSNKTLLNSAIYSFVEDVAFSLAEGHRLSLRFRFPKGLADEEKKRVESIFRAHYAIRYRSLRDRLTKEMILAITFVFIGFVLITLHLPYVNADSNSVYGEMLDIFGWVFTWEAVEILCVNSLENQAELHRSQLLYTAEIAEEEGPQAIVRASSSTPLPPQM
jgi:hypothetical protein